MMKLSYLWVAPEINPINRKARSIPIFNIWNIYGRVFFFSWFGFMVAFWAWYTFPPLITHVIKADLGLTPAEVANSNIVSLIATLFIRYLAGPLCDQFGPRRVFAGVLLVGSIPLGLAPLVHDARSLYVSRFFLGILGGSFVPCLVWSTGFFDRNVVGSANALAGGWGNAGGGITYFIMPAVFDAFHARGYGNRAAWRLTFIVPLIVTITTGVGMLLLCPDTPTGKWSERHLHAGPHGGDRGGGIVDVPGEITAAPTSSVESKCSDSETEKNGGGKDDKHGPSSQVRQQEEWELAAGETIEKPTLRGVLAVLTSPQTLFHLATYLCSFGGELAINSVLSAYYLKNVPGIGHSTAANVAAVFGFLNVVTRPLGGFVADYLYHVTGRSLWAKKIWIVACGLATGSLLVAIGQADPRALGPLLGLVSLMAVFLEAGNGANFALIPHVHPRANGVVSGTTGAAGNLGGVAFSVLFRFVDDGTNYAKAFWLIGVIHIVLNLALCWVPPVPRGQVGGR
ncbi:putative nitrate transporter [Rosellinia necatrix]|uniref:Nitrate/nitrite transporter n=1 Tax=Rosellinia necatrix TaxID=77044 RepID=A0A1W2TPQ3_ROSNE|nr:putative nitrate transporter [Rosellinia necatrix]